MIKRIVKMTFKPEHVQDFIKLFNLKRSLIAAVPGCKHLELLQDMDNKNVFFTYSFWEGEFFLEDYRNSELFKSVWAQTKLFFLAKAEAWSVQSL